MIGILLKYSNSKAHWQKLHTETGQQFQELFVSHKYYYLNELPPLQKRRPRPYVIRLWAQTLNLGTGTSDCVTKLVGVSFDTKPSSPHTITELLEDYTPINLPT